MAIDLGLRSKKSTLVGRQERCRLVVEYFGSQVFAIASGRYMKSIVKDDDILDAFAALRTAERLIGGAAQRMAEPVR
jgi:hypothetical protein